MVEMARQDFGNFGKDLGLVHEAVIMGRKVGAGHDFWAKLAHDERLFQEILWRVRSESYQETDSQKRAAGILGFNFFGIKDGVKYLGINPTTKQQDDFAEIPFLEATLEECRDSHILTCVFGPEQIGIGIMDNTEKKEWKGWSVKWKEGWQLIQKIPVAGSLNKSWANQLDLLRHNEESPDLFSFYFSVLAHFLKTKERLFKECAVRTSTHTSNWVVPHCGYFSSPFCKPMIGADFRSTKYSIVGLAVTRK